MAHMQNDLYNPYFDEVYTNDVAEFTKALIKKTYGVDVKVECRKEFTGDLWSDYPTYTYVIYVNGVMQFGFSDYELNCPIEEVAEWFIEEMNTTF